MRVVHVVRQFAPSVGGLEDFVLSLARQQAREGFYVEVITLNRIFAQPEARLGSEDLVRGVPVRRISYSGSYKYPLAPSVYSHIKTFDLVHVHGIDFFCDFLSITRHLHRKPLVISTHGGFFHTGYAKSLKQIYFSTLTKFSLAGFDRVLACSSNDFDIFKRIVPKKLKLIENGVDIHKFRDSASTTFSTEMAYIGRLAVNKGLDELLESFAMISVRVPTSRLHIIGNDFDNMREALQKKISELKIDTKIKFYQGLTDEEVKKVLNSCSFFVSASRYEGFGLSLIEGMSAGLIPIANSIESFKRIIARSSVGLLTDFSDLKRVADEVPQFIRDTRTNYDELRAAAISASNQYGWSSVAQKFTTEYESVVGKNQRTILGICINNMSQSEAVSAIDESFSQGGPLRVAFANAHTVNSATRIPKFREALSRFLVLNDGLGIDLASRLKYGTPFNENLNGTDFVPNFLEMTRHRLKIFLLGSSSEVVTEAMKVFQERWPKHEYVGCRHGFNLNESQDSHVRRQIQQSGADVVIVGMGNPLQEMWIDRNADETGARLFFGVGALFDFTVGKVPRAPLWVRKVRCEWLFRLYQEPSRLWRRYIVGNVVFLKNVLYDSS